MLESQRRGSTCFSLVVVTLALMFRVYVEPPLSRASPLHNGVMLRAPSLWLRPPYLLVKPLEPYWKASLCEHVHLLKRHLTSTTFNCFGLLRGHVWICPSFGNKRFIPSSIIRSNIMGVHSIMYVFEKMIACTVVAFVPFIVQLVADEAHQQWMYNGLFLAVDN